MRILIVHEALAGGGGVESYLATLIPALGGRGHDIAFLHQNTEAQTGPTRLAFAGVPRASAADEGAQAAVDRLLAWKPDLCFSHNLHALDLEDRLASRAPLVKMMHGYFGTCVSGQKSHAVPVVTACTREFGTACLALYLPRRCGQLRPAKMLRQYAWARRQHALLERYRSVVVASEHMAAEYRRHGAADVTVAPLFPTEPIAATPRPLPAHPTVLFAGRMTHLKGGETLVKAASVANALLPHAVRLVFAGEGPERERWRALAAARGVHAEFPGWVTGEARTALFREATLVAVPSLWPEPFGLIGLEAAAHGVPAVAFDTGGVRQWLRDGVGGRTVSPPGDADHLGRAIANLVSRPEELERLGAGARRTAEVMTVDAHIDILEGVFARAAAS